MLFNNGVSRSYRVKGVFDANFQQSNNIAYISQKEMESVLGLEDKASLILIKTRDKGDENSYIKQFLELGIKEEIKESVIIHSYILQAMFYAISGTIIGLFIMFFILKPWFVTHPLKFPVGFVSLLIVPEKVMVNTISLIAAALAAGLIPSWMAVRETILEAILGRLTPKMDVIL